MVDLGWALLSIMGEKCLLGAYDIVVVGKQQWSESLLQASASD